MSNNNITGELPNKHITYLTEAYDARYNKYDYSVWNDGNLYLENNTFDYIIFNNGTIHTPTTIYIMNNETWYEDWNATFQFWANITDDNNTIISVDTLDTWNDVEGEGKLYSMPYNYRKIDCQYQGIFVIHLKDSGLVNPVEKPGTIVVKMPTTVTIDYTNNQQEDIPFAIKVTIPVNSNFTFDWNKFKVKINGEPVDGLRYTRNLINGTLGDKWIEAYVNFTEFHMPVGTYTITADYEGDDYHWNASASDTLSLFLRPMWITVHADDIFYGGTIYVIVNSSAVNTVNGRITIYIDGKAVSVPLKLDNATGSYVYELPNADYPELLEPGKHILSVTFANGTYYGVESNSSEFYVYALNTTINATPTDIEYGENEIIDVAVNENATGYIAVRIGERIFSAPIVDGKAKFNITGLCRQLH